ncbi:MAG: hypothetical protein NTY65_04970 [Planctomycetota bacterium]|nr:hypothetical protein [Planctomycetota bacterium]
MDSDPKYQALFREAKSEDLRGVFASGKAEKVRLRREAASATERGELSELTFVHAPWNTLDPDVRREALIVAETLAESYAPNSPQGRALGKIIMGGGKDVGGAVEEQKERILRIIREGQGGYRTSVAGYRTSVAGYGIHPDPILADRIAGKITREQAAEAYSRVGRGEEYSAEWFHPRIEGEGTAMPFQEAVGGGKEPADMTQAEFVAANRDNFYRHPVRKRLFLKATPHSVWTIPDEFQANGRLIRPKDEVLGAMHRSIVEEQIAIAERGQAFNALPYERGKPMPSPEALAAYPDLAASATPAPASGFLFQEAGDKRPWEGSGLPPLPDRVPVVHVDPSAVIEATRREGSLRKGARAAAKAFAGRTVTNNHTGWPIDISMEGVRHATSHAALTRDQFLVTAAIPDLLQSAVLTGTAADRLGRKEVLAVHTLYAPAEMGDKFYRVKMIVRETRDGRLFYDQHTLENKMPAGLPGLAVTGGNPPSAGITSMSITDLLREVKEGPPRGAPPSAAGSETLFQSAADDAAGAARKPKPVDLLRPASALLGLPGQGKGIDWQTLNLQPSLTPEMGAIVADLRAKDGARLALEKKLGVAIADLQSSEVAYSFHPAWPVEL